MHILHIYKDYFPVLGGIENHVRTLAELECAAGHRVTVLVTNPGGLRPQEMLNGVQLLRLPRLASLASTPISFSYPGAIRKLHPDITQLHFPYPVGEVSQFLAGQGRPYVVTYHSDVVRQKGILRLYRSLLERVLDRAGRILPTSEPYMRSSPFLGPRQARCTVVGLCVDPGPFREAPRLIPSDGRPNVLFVGRHRYYKGVEDLIRAMQGLEARLLIGGDGPMRSEWERLVREMGMAQQVLFTGEVPDEDLPGLYASADLFVLPANSRAEAFGKVLLEAMASGLACVTTELDTGTSYVVQDGVSGLVVPPHDPAALRIAVQALLGDGGRRGRMGAAGRERVLAEFTPEKMLAKVMRVYEEVLGEDRLRS